jgi:hypothetical protein
MTLFTDAQLPLFGAHQGKLLPWWVKYQQERNIDGMVL